MRYRRVPQIDGITDPLGSVRSPYSEYGKIPSLRLAASEPELIGQDPIPYLETDGFGATVIAGSNYGALGQIIDQKRTNPVTAIADVLETFRQSGKKAGLDTAAAISVREGVPVTEAALEVLATKKMGPQELQRRIAGVSAQLRTARSKRQTTKAKNLSVRLAALKARLRDVQSGKKQAIADDKAIAGDSNRIAPWVTYASLAVGVAGLFVALYGMTRKKK